MEVDICASGDTIAFMAKACKQIRIKIPADIHKKLKMNALECGKTLAQRIIEILTARMERP